ncbi:MAG: PH domain-containing protein [Roseiflexaceae bacterium]|nr:PH domain-containing protein [Roseiflexaceae bacterium]
MRRWKPQPSIGRWIAIGLFIITLAAIIAPLLRITAIFSGPPESWVIDTSLFGWCVLLLVLVAASAVFGYRAAAAFTLAYELDRNGLYIVWLGSRAVVPLDQITNLDVGIDLAPTIWQIFQRIGYYGGQSQTIDGRLVHLFTTQALSSSLVVHTPDTSYVISPADNESFVQDLEQRRNLGSTKPLAVAVESGRMFLYAFWSDRTIRWLLAVALFFNLIALAVLASRYTSLAPMLQMRFDPAGQAADIRPRHQVLFIPLAALGLSLVNLMLGVALYRRQQLSAYLLQGASVIVQILFAIALVTLIR